MIKEVRAKDYLDRLKELNLWTLEERRNRADLVELFKMYKASIHHCFRSRNLTSVNMCADPSTTLTLWGVHKMGETRRADA